MKKRVGWFFGGAGVFLLFVFFSYLVHRNLFTQLDFNTTVRLQDRIPRKFDDFFSWFSVIGSFEVTGTALLLFLGALVVLRRKIIGVVGAIVAGFGFIGFHLVEIYGKTFVKHFPPPEFMLRTKKLIELPEFNIRKEFSYPSGHAGRAAFISAVLILFTLRAKKLSKTQKMFIYCSIALYDVIMFTSRIYLGEHWLTDVIGGILLGGSLGIIAGAF